jgi:hypothetical protein
MIKVTTQVGASENQPSPFGRHRNRWRLNLSNGWGKSSMGEESQITDFK